MKDKEIKRFKDLRFRLRNGGLFFPEFQEFCKLSGKYGNIDNK